MKFKEIQITIELAERFIKSAKKVKQSSYGGKMFDGIETGKESGALRRASLDLTRQLATMRKPN